MPLPSKLVSNLKKEAILAYYEIDKTNTSELKVFEVIENAQRNGWRDDDKVWLSSNTIPLYLIDDSYPVGFVDYEDESVTAIQAHEYFLSAVHEAEDELL